MVLFAVMLAVSAGAAEGPKAVRKSPRLDAIVQDVVANGRDGVLPGPIAATVGITGSAPYRGARIPADQATDGMDHVIKVLVEKTSEDDPGKPVGLELSAGRDSPGMMDTYHYHVSLDGKLENASLITGKTDENGRAIKGSGEAIAKDVESSDVKKRFQHELDVWLKRSYLKKEWRSAAISDGGLKK